MPRISICAAFFVLVLSIQHALFADGLRDNVPESVRQVPPKGVELSADNVAAFQKGLAKLKVQIAELRSRTDAKTKRLLPDVEVFARAVEQGVKHHELFSPRDITNCGGVMNVGLQRASQLLAGEAPWTTQTGLVVRGFRSRIDQTVQPYGLVVPETYRGKGNAGFRLDIWLHGRGERSSEPVFIHERMTKVGRYAPRNTLVLHPYGRYSNAFKFAGEIDVLEAMQHVRENYQIDEDRVAIRGFSMGGAGCWQMAVHYPGLFFAANPGAGFSETPEFLRFFQKETLNPTWYEKSLWQMYDCPGYAMNLYNLPTIAYSGELDIQKQAADEMEKAFAANKMKLTHIIGPQTKHTIHPDSMKTIEAKLDSIARVGRQRVPEKVRFRTYTLRYPRSHWVELTRLKEHWKQAAVDATLNTGANEIELRVRNIAGITLNIPAGYSEFEPTKPVRVRIVDEDHGNAHQPMTVICSPPASDRSWEAEFHVANNQWKLGPPVDAGLAKKHMLQGPIDDAFMDSFIVVKPTGTAAHGLVGKWTEREMKHFIAEWRRQFRGDAVVKNDTEITAKDIADNHLILFGDFASNAIIKSVLPDLPLTWSVDTLQLGKGKYDPAHHAPVMIYPNPENPSRYVVINSGFTYREYAYLNNARQVPKLPDWGVVDLRTPADSLWPGKIVDAQFFDDQWRLKK